MSQRFFTNCPLMPGLVTLEGPEAHHIAAVCRLRPGDLVTLFNGDGHEYPARLVDVSCRHVDLDVGEQLSPVRELSLPLEVAAPLPKGDRGQFLVEKLTELGVTTFVPLLCQHSVIHPRQGHVDKLRRHVIEASKQCGRNVLMNIEEPTPWAAYCARDGKLDELRILAHPDKIKAGGDGVGVPALAGHPLMVRLKPGLQHPLPARIAVGPEGGFTDEEVELARSSGWQIINLGPRVLRVETAALVLAVWMISS